MVVRYTSDAVATGVCMLPIHARGGAETSRKDAGNVRFEVWQQTSRQNHSTIVEVWQDQPAFEAHVRAGHTRQFREKFQPLSGSLYDERLYKALD